MRYEQITAMLKQIGLPFAYHHFAEGESPEPPFLVYLCPNRHNFSADGKVYFRANALDIELYTDRKSPETEELVEGILDRFELFYEKSETFIQSEQLYEVLYELEV